MKSPPPDAQRDVPVILFDGRCGLCGGLVRFVSAHDDGPRIRFAALQTEEGELMLNSFGLTDVGTETVVFIEGEGIWIESDAVVRIAGYLRPPWRWLGAARLIPKPIRDLVYRLIARHRYRFFGCVEECDLLDLRHQSFNQKVESIEES